MSKSEQETATITVENIKRYHISNEAREDIKQSLEHVLRTDPTILIQAVESVLKEKNEPVDSLNEELELKTFEKAEAKQMIKEYIDNNSGCKTSEIILKLSIDPMQAMEILKELRKEQVVQTKDV